MCIVLGASPLRTAALVAGLVLLATTTVYSADLIRVEWSPGGGIVGDLWTFRCPAGGSVLVGADALPDRPIGEGSFQSTLDLALELFDGSGNLVSAGDDEIACSTSIACGAGCPFVDAPCGTGVKHSIVVRVAGTAPRCEGGGTYLLTVVVLDAEGDVVPNSAVKLGGGPTRNLPPWIRDLGTIAGRGPLIDDGPIPTPFADALATESRMLPR